MHSRYYRYVVGVTVGQPVGDGVDVAVVSTFLKIKGSTQEMQCSEGTVVQYSIANYGKESWFSERRMVFLSAKGNEDIYSLNE